MRRGNPNRYADRIVFWACVIIGVGLYTDGVYQYGYKHGQALKVCAVVPGQQVVSSTADVCTYANSYGRATTKRRAG